MTLRHYLMLICAVLAWGLWFIDPLFQPFTALGCSCNILAMFFNELKMPVLSPSPIDDKGETKFHRVLTKEAKFYYLCDIFGGRNFRFSIGDVLLIVGILVQFWVV